MNKKFYIFTLGCQMNISDSQRIAKKLKDLGYQSAPENGADLVIVNACSVRQKGIDRIWGKIRNWQKQNKKILITGCVLKADGRKFSQKNIEVFNIKGLPNLKKILDEHSNIRANNRISSKKLILSSDLDLDYFKIEPEFSGETFYIPIMTGCDNFCSYCAVPYTRGREISRSEKDIITEVKKALDSGCKEIWLLGQNVNSYGIKSEARNPKKIKNDKFIELLKTIDNIDRDFSFNFMSSNPHDMGGDLIETFATLKKWPRELHLAMQSGDDEILKKMNRKYTADQFLELVKKLRSAPLGMISDLRLSTDIIVGFPGETEKQFNNTVKICKKINFEKAYISQYSPRSGTVSAKMKDDVTPAEKKRRWLILNKLINENNRS